MGVLGPSSFVGGRTNVRKISANSLRLYYREENFALTHLVQRLHRHYTL